MMDLRTGQTYETAQDAIAAGVPPSDLAHVEQRLRDGRPIVKFSKGSFKSYVRDAEGQLVRAK
jgi:hypothetical protein